MTTRYYPEHMRRFREARPDLDDLPDHIVASLMVFAWFAFGEAVRDLGRVIRAEYPIIERMFP